MERSFISLTGTRFHKCSEAESFSRRVGLCYVEALGVSHNGQRRLCLEPNCVKHWSFLNETSVGV